MLARFSKNRHRLIFLSSGLYFLGVSAFMLRRNIWLSPDQFFIFALVLATFLGTGRKFIHDWSPVILIFLSYEFLRGAMPAIVKFPIHSTDLIMAERNIFGVIPTVFLQKIWLNPTHLSWYDFAFSLAYMSFFIVPLGVGFYLWLKDHSLFRFFSYSFLLLFYLAFITFVVFPAMPPWMAADKGLIQEIHRVLYLTTAQMTIHGSFPTVYTFFAPNDVAAIPSLHAALPTLMFLVAAMKKRYLLAVFSLGYAMIIYASVVYLGEHYAIDAIIGILYALVAFLVTKVAVAKVEELMGEGLSVGNKAVVASVEG